MYLPTDVQSSTIHSSQKMEASKCLSTDEQSVVYACNRIILFSLERKEIQTRAPTHMKLKPFCRVKQARHKRTSTARSHLHKAPRVPIHTGRKWKGGSQGLGEGWGVRVCWEQSFSLGK